MLAVRSAVGRAARIAASATPAASCSNMTFPNSNGPGGYANGAATIDCPNILISKAASATAVEGSGVLTVDTTVASEGSWIYSTVPKSGAFNLRGDLKPLILDSALMSMEIGTTLRTRDTANSQTTSQIIILIQKLTSDPNVIQIYVFRVAPNGSFQVMAAPTIEDDGAARRISIERTATHFVVDVKNADTLVSDLGGPSSTLITNVLNGADDSYIGAGYCDAQIAEVGANTGTIDNLVNWA